MIKLTYDVKNVYLFNDRIVDGLTRIVAREGQLHIRQIERAVAEHLDKCRNLDFANKTLS